MKTRRLIVPCLLLTVSTVCGQEGAPRTSGDNTVLRAANVDRKRIARMVSDAARVQREQARLSSSSEEERLDAVVNLAAINTLASARASVTAGRDRSPRVRAAAITAWGNLPDVERDALVREALNDRDEFVRQRAAYAVGDVAERDEATNVSNETPRVSSAVIAALIQLAAQDKSAAVRGAAVVSLGKLKARDSVTTLVDLLNTRRRARGFFNRVRRRREDENEFVQRAAIVTLGRIGDKRAVGDLSRLLMNTDTPPDLKREAARALGLIGDASALPGLSVAETSTDPYLSAIAREARQRIQRNANISTRTDATGNAGIPARIDTKAQIKN